jgi:hypothetical protein
MTMADDPKKKKLADSNGTANTTGAGRALPQEVIAEIRKQAVQQVAKTTIWAAVGFLTVAGAGWLLYLKDKVPGWVNGVPKGAVAAFDLSDGCPEEYGWKPFEAAAGRFILGAGEGKNLKERAIREIGGFEETQLTVTELPSHVHDFIGTAVTKGGNGGTGRVLAVGDGVSHGTFTPEGTISAKGEGKAFSNVPPYIALIYCKKG